MHSFLVALAYLAMVFAPCAIAQWGDVLIMPWNFRFGRRRRALSIRFPALDARMIDVLRRQEAAEMAQLFTDAFVAPAPLPASARFAAQSALKSGAHATPQTLMAAMRQASLPGGSAFEIARARVAARLNSLVEAHALANTPLVANSAAEAIERAVPMYTAEDSRQYATPTAAELNALYGRESVDTLQPAEFPPQLEPVVAGAPMHLVPDALPGRQPGHKFVRTPDASPGDPIFFAETPPHTIAA